MACVCVRGVQVEKADIKAIDVGAGATAITVNSMRML